VPLSDEDGRELKVELMRADLALKQKQATTNPGNPRVDAGPDP
jgi:hypothetical protein